MNVRIAGWLVAPAVVLAQQPPCTVAVPAVFAVRALPVLRQVFGHDVVVAATAAITMEPPPGAHVLFGWDEWTFARLAAVVDHELAFEVRHGTAVLTAVCPTGIEELTWEDLALRSDFHDRLGIVAPEVDGSVWLLARQHALGRGRDDAAIALWTTLDARANHLLRGYDVLERGLEDGSLAVGIGPLAFLEPMVASAAGRLRLVRLGDGAAVARLGIGIVTNGGAVASAAADRLRVPANRQALADALGLALARPGPASIGLDEARGLWMRFEQDVRGRGRGAERIADWLDLTFGVLFVVCAFVLWRVLRRDPPAAA